MSNRTLTAAQTAFLEQLFPGEDCLFAPEQTLVYGTDSSRLFAPPLAVVRASGHNQLVELLRWARAESMPIYIRARATNVVGDCVPDPPGVVLSMLKMNRIREISEDDFVAVVEPGVVTAEFQAEVEKRGLFYPPDPASIKVSTIGGNVATCAGGMRAVKYGVTREYVLGLTAVLAGGEVLRTGSRCHKNVVGLDLTRLIVGSEGSLACLSDITLKLLPKPEQTASLLAGYPSMAEALEGARMVFAAGILPVALEFMAREVLDCLALITSPPWPADTDAALLFRLDGSHDALAMDIRRLDRVIAASKPSFLAKGLGPEEEEPLWELRRLINPASFLVKPDKMSDDVTVPRGRVAKAVDAIQTLGREMDLTILVFGHLGDGNLHVNIMHDAKNEGELARAREAKSRILDLVLELGGSLSGEHGTGLTKAPYLDRQLGARERELMRTMKKVFDPSGILNPGKGF